MVRRTSCVGIVLYHEDSVLLVKHTEKSRLPLNSYGFPAGRVDDGETLVDAAIRELKEETGLITSFKYLRKLKPKESRIVMSGGYEYFSFHPFLCTNYSGILKNSDKTIPEFVTLNNLDDILLVSDDVKELSREHYVNNKKY